MKHGYIQCIHCSGTGKLIYGIYEGLPCPVCKSSGKVIEPREIVGKCWICDKILHRDEYKTWVYYQEILVCRNHPGVGSWYKGAIKMSEEKLKLSLLQDINEK